MTSAHDARPPITANTRPLSQGNCAQDLSACCTRKAGEQSAQAAHLTPQADAQPLAFDGWRDQRSTSVVQTLATVACHLVRVFEPGPVHDTLACPVGSAMTRVLTANAAARSRHGPMGERVSHQGAIDCSASLGTTCQLSANEPFWRVCILEFPLVAMSAMNHEQIACPSTAFVIGFAKFGLLQRTLLVKRLWRSGRGPNPAFLPLRQSLCGTAP